MGGFHVFRPDSDPVVDNLDVCLSLVLVLDINIDDRDDDHVQHAAVPPAVLDE